MKNKIERRLKRRKRIRSKIFGTSKVPRLSVFRSNKHIYAQIIDDEKGETLVAASDLELKQDGGKKDPSRAHDGVPNKKGLQKGYAKTYKARMVGEILAKKALKKKISRVVFDRGGYKYHGRVKALAEGARKGGLKF